MQRTYPWQAGARGRLLLFNLLVVSVTLMVSVVAIFGFRHAGAIQEQAQAQTLADMNGSLALARDTANVATAAVRREASRCSSDKYTRSKLCQK